MYRCLQLAKLGIGTTHPNPSVGAVLVYNDKIIGEGYTSNYGGAHAEVNAIQSVKDLSLIKKATLYVTLEPCAHFGKTPPCADLIISKKIPNVVIGTIDTHSVVAGKGIEKLRAHGCDVLVGVLEDECKNHHKRFFTFQNKNRPYIILKWAETSNGFIAPKQKEKLSPVWISNIYAQQLTHKWRAEEHAILVGTNTVLADNPKLNVRKWTGQNPIRIVIDRSLKINTDLSIYDASVKTIVITELQQKNNHEHLIFEVINFDKNVPKQILDVLTKHKIQSIIIEGGTLTLQSFINDNLWDEARVFIGNNDFEDGIDAPIFQATLQKEKRIANNILRIYSND